MSQGNAKGSGGGGGSSNATTTTYNPAVPPNWPTEPSQVAQSLDEIATALTVNQKSPILNAYCFYFDSVKNVMWMGDGCYGGQTSNPLYAFNPSTLQVIGVDVLPANDYFTAAGKIIGDTNYVYAIGYQGDSQNIAIISKTTYTLVGLLNSSASVFDITFDGSGNIWACEGPSAVVVQYLASDITTAITNGPTAPQPPSGITFAPPTAPYFICFDGTNLWVSDNAANLYQYNTSGTQLNTTYTATGLTAFTQFTGLLYYGGYVWCSTKANSILQVNVSTFTGGTGVGGGVYELDFVDTSILTLTAYLDSFSNTILFGSSGDSIVRVNPTATPTLSNQIPYPTGLIQTYHNYVVACPSSSSLLWVAGNGPFIGLYSNGVGTEVFETTLTATASLQFSQPATVFIPGSLNTSIVANRPIAPSPAAAGPSSVPLSSAMNGVTLTSSTTLYTEQYPAQFPFSGIANVQTSAGIQQAYYYQITYDGTAWAIAVDYVPLSGTGTLSTGGLVTYQPAVFQGVVDLGSNTVVGGTATGASEQFATVSGGDQNSAQGTYATCSGGYQNLAGSIYSTVVGGANNTSDGSYSTSGGQYSTAYGQAGIAIGLSATSSGGGAVALGFGNATGYMSVAIGYQALAIQDYSVVVGGYQGLATRVAQSSFTSSGTIVSGGTVIGDSQAGKLVYSGIQSYTGAPGTAFVLTDIEHNELDLMGDTTYNLNSTQYYSVQVRILATAANSNATAHGPAHWLYEILTHTVNGALIIDNSQQMITTPDPNSTGWITSVAPDAPVTSSIDTPSNAQTLPTSIIYLTSVVGFTPTGHAVIATATGPQQVAYTGITGNTLTGCTGGSGTLVTGQTVNLQTSILHITINPNGDSTNIISAVADINWVEVYGFKQ